MRARHSLFNSNINIRNPTYTYKHQDRKSVCNNFYFKIGCYTFWGFFALSLMIALPLTLLDNSTDDNLSHHNNSTINNLMVNKLSDDVNNTLSTIRNSNTSIEDYYNEIINDEILDEFIDEEILDEIDSSIEDIYHDGYGEIIDELDIPILDELIDSEIDTINNTNVNKTYIANVSSTIAYEYSNITHSSANITELIEIVDHILTKELNISNINNITHNNASIWEDNDEQKSFIDSYKTFIIIGICLLGLIVFALITSLYICMCTQANRIHPNHIDQPIQQDYPDNYIRDNNSMRLV